MNLCEELVILGAGGFGREMVFIISEINRRFNRYKILGFVDNDLSLKGKTINGYPVLGDDIWLLNYQKKVNLVICIGNPKARERAVAKYSTRCNVVFPNIVADNAKCSDDIKMGKGCIICFSAIITVNVTLGDFVLVMNNSVIGHDSVLADFSTILPSTTVSGNVSIGKHAEIGVGTNIIQQKSIGKNVIIGAGAVVVSDIPDNCTAVGVPAKPIKYHKLDDF